MFKIRAKFSCKSLQKMSLKFSPLILSTTGSKFLKFTLKICRYLTKTRTFFEYSSVLNKKISLLRQHIQFVRMLSRAIMEQFLRTVKQVPAKLSLSLAFQMTKKRRASCQELSKIFSNKSRVTPRDSTWLGPVISKSTTRKFEIC